MHRDTSIFFVVDGPKLEAQSILLSPTIKKFASAYKTYAYVRSDRRDQLSALALSMLEKCNIELREIPHTKDEKNIVWSQPYPIGNKILAAADDRKCNISVFIDTDTVFVNTPNFADILGDSDVAAVPSDYNTGGNTEADWASIYDFFDVEMPTERMRLLAGRRVSSPPYYNAGMVIFKEDPVHSEGKRFSEIWLENAIQFERNYKSINDRINIDQMTLPVSAFQLGLKINTLPNKYNYNIRSRAIQPDSDAYILHYHQVVSLWRSPAGHDVINDVRDLLGADDFQKFRKDYWAFLRPRKFRHLVG